MSTGFSNSANASIVFDVINAIQRNKELLGEVDGKIGDGDHGVNMNKGFTMAGGRIEDGDSFSTALNKVGRTLIMDIGGSMGPLYGTLMKKMAKSTKELDTIDAPAYLAMFQAGLDGIREISPAKVGDKTMMDTLEPAVAALQTSIETGKNFAEALQASSKAAEAGKESTKDMTAKIGRSSRLGERSRGTLDAGATSCCIIIQTMNQSVTGKL